MLQQRLLAVIAQQLQIDEAQVRPDVSFSELGADSMDVADLLMRIEEELDLPFLDSEITGLQTVGDVLARVQPQPPGTLVEPRPQQHEDRVEHGEAGHQHQDDPERDRRPRSSRSIGKR